MAKNSSRFTEASQLTMLISAKTPGNRRFGQETCEAFTFRQTDGETAASEAPVCVRTGAAMFFLPPPVAKWSGLQKLTLCN